jgi:hypothetical protein
MRIDAFRMPKQEILFAAFGGWDAAGAKSFGYETYWTNRLNLPVEELGIESMPLAAALWNWRNSQFVRRSFPFAARTTEALSRCT